jgi:small redox-active disulfide protein 2
MNIKILGTGCKSCLTLEANVKKALLNCKREADVEKVTDYADIVRYGIMSTPGLVIDGKVVSYGKVISTDEVCKLISGTTGCC